MTHTRARTLARARARAHVRTHLCVSSPTHAFAERSTRTARAGRASDETEESRRERPLGVSSASPARGTKRKRLDSPAKAADDLRRGSRLPNDDDDDDDSGDCTEIRATHAYSRHKVRENVDDERHRSASFSRLRLSKGRMPGSQRRQMMQPWPLCLAPFARTKVRSHPPPPRACTRHPHPSGCLLLRGRSVWFPGAGCRSPSPVRRRSPLVRSLIEPPNVHTCVTHTCTIVVFLSLSLSLSRSPSATSPTLRPLEISTASAAGRRLPRWHVSFFFFFSRLSGRELSFPVPFLWYRHLSLPFLSSAPPPLLRLASLSTDIGLSLYSVSRFRDSHIFQPLDREHEAGGGRG